MGQCGSDLIMEIRCNSVSDYLNAADLSYAESVKTIKQRYNSADNKGDEPKLPPERRTDDKRIYDRFSTFTIPSDGRNFKFVRPRKEISIIDLLMIIWGRPKCILASKQPV